MGQDIRDAEMLMHARNLEAIRPRSNDERREQWASKFFALGLHRRPDKPRYRVTVPEPLSKVRNSPAGGGADNTGSFVK